jgi:hypothetical protein
MEPSEDIPLWKKLVWFAVLWIGGVLAVGAFAYLLRFLIPG